MVEARKCATGQYCPNMVGPRATFCSACSSSNYYWNKPDCRRRLPKRAEFLRKLLARATNKLSGRMVRPVGPRIVRFPVQQARKRRRSA